MRKRPTLQTERLELRPFGLSDAGDVQRLAGDRAIADTTANIPHPYADGVAEQWISTHQARFEAGELINFAITLRSTQALIGGISLMNIAANHERGEIGYWIGKPSWGRGYGTEAAKAVLAHGFSVLGLNRIYGHYLRRNPASGRVLEKIGMTQEGCLRQHDKKWGQFEDLVVCGMLRSEWDRRAGPREMMRPEPAAGNRKPAAGDAPGGPSS